MRCAFSVAVMACCASMLLAATVLPGRAALPPYWQRTAEIRAVLDSREVTEKLKTRGVITSIEWIAHNLYRVRAGNCELEVRLRHEPPPQAKSNPHWIGGGKMVVESTNGPTCK